MEGCSQDHGGITDRSDIYKNISENKDEKCFYFIMISTTNKFVLKKMVKITLRKDINLRSTAILLGTPIL